MRSVQAERSALYRGLLAVMRFSEEAMVLSDPHQHDNPIVAVNPAFEALTQYSQAEVIGRNCRLLQGRATDPDSVRQLRGCIARGEGCVQFLRNHRRDGAPFWNLLFVAPVCGHDGALHFFFASQRDISAGPPLDLAGVPLGPAHMTPGQQTEFRLLLLDIAEDVAAAARSETLAGRVRALEAALHKAREIALLSTRLYPGAPG